MIERGQRPAPVRRWRRLLGRIGYTTTAALIMVMLAFGTACTETTAATTDVASLVVTPPTAIVRAGSTVTLGVQARDTDGNLIAAPVLTWSTSNTAVATVSTAGVVTATAPGDVRIAVSSMGKSAIANLTVTPRPVASLRVTPAQAAVLVSGTVRLTATPLDADGAALGTCAVTWSSSDVAVARVDAAGVVTGVSPGAATISATCDGRTAQVAVTVALPPVQTVTVSPARDTVVVSGERQLSATLRDVSGAVLAGRAVSWGSSNVAVAVVSATGVLTALAPGTVTISASSEGRTGTATVTVVARLAGAVTLTPGLTSVVVGNTVTLQAQVTDDQGNLLSGRPVNFVSEAPSIASVTASGVVTALAVGTVRIVATSEGKSGVATVQVIPVPVASVQLSPSTLRITTGESQGLTATLRAQNGALLTGRTLEWRSGAPNVASVNGSGTVTALSPGVAVILATVEGVTASSEVTVQRPSVAAIQLTPAEPSVNAGGTVQLTAVVRDSGGNTLGDRVVSWSSSNEQVAFVSSTGLVVGSRPGTATITVTSEGISASIIVTVR